jgi:8-oxo-dGTP pyrophosphatase MutT (NUDIX family)
MFMVSGQLDFSNETPTSGKWGETSWELVASPEVPDPELCTAAGCVAIRDVENQEVVLTYTKSGRGPGVPPRWELPSGHIDPLDSNNPKGPRESPAQAAARETREETGFAVTRAVPFAYREITNHPGSGYPEFALMPYYWATTDQPPGIPTDPGTICGSFLITSVEMLAQEGAVPVSDLHIIKLGLARQELLGIPYEP